MLQRLSLMLSTFLLKCAVYSKFDLKIAQSGLLRVNFRKCMPYYATKRKQVYQSQKLGILGTDTGSGARGAHFEGVT